MQTLHRVGKARFGTVRLNLGELLRKGDGAAGADAAVVGLGLGGGVVGRGDLIGDVDLTAGNRADIAVLQAFGVVGAQRRLLLEDLRGDNRGNLHRNFAWVGDVLRKQQGARVDDRVDEVAGAAGGAGHALAGVLDQGVDVGVGGGGKRCGGGVQRGLHHLGAGLHPVEVVDLEVEVLRLINDQLLGVVGERCGGGDVGVLGVVGDGDGNQTADLDGAALFLDVPLVHPVAVCHADISAVECVKEGFAPDFGNKVYKCHDFDSFLIFKF